MSIEVGTLVDTGTHIAGGIGARAIRPDGIAKVRGEFSFAGDLWADGMLWGQALRSPHPSARIRSIDTGPALLINGVHAVLTADDVPVNQYGLEHRDQPVLAGDIVRYAGEPVAVVAADHPDIARRACEAIVVDYEVLAPLTDAELASAAPPLHPDGNVFRDLVIRRGDTGARGPVVVEGTYEIGMQDQAFMGPEAGLATPTGDGGVDLVVSTQWLHNDRDQVAECLGLASELVRLSLGGVGGAFGAREDVSLHIHSCLLAVHTGRPVKIVYSRTESFFGHVHRHPARIWMRHTAMPDGEIVSFEARILLDGGAYRSSSYHVTANAACFAAGPYRVPNAHVHATAVRTNNPPCGAMRGFGVVQSCFAHEAQMDRLADACGLDPVELRLRNALAPGDELLTGQRIEGTLPVADVIRKCAALPLPAPAADDVLARPGGAGRTSAATDVRRGVGFAVGFKNLMYAEGYMDGSVARCHIDEGIVTISCAAAEVGQGFVTLVQQIGRTVLGVDDVIVAPADTGVGSAGSTSASRQTMMSGGAVEKACRTARAELDARAAARGDAGALDVGALTASEPIDVTEEYHHRLTHPLDADGQGDAHVSFACAAHRAIVDVDPELGLVRVVHLATAQDVGRALNPLQVTGQIEGGIAQGVGLAVMEELILENGQVRNASFTDYLIPTALDAPTVEAVLIEEPEPGAPFGAKGVGEPPTISSTPAIVAAIRAATGAPCTRVSGPTPRHRPMTGIAIEGLEISLPRLRARLDALAEIGAIDGGGCARLALTDEDRRGRDLVVSWMRDLGLRIDVDEIGNVVGTWPADSTDAPVMTGSHIDTVATGGRFDGTLGVLAGLEVLETVITAGVEPARPLAVAFFTDEEGSRFAPDMLGSLVYAGGLPLEDALALRAIDGAVVGEELLRIGYAGPQPCPGRPPHAFVELHIEQGPVLEAEDVTIGAVAGVQGISWTELTITGQSNHAGTTPMAMRHDAGYAAAEVASFVRRLAVDMGPPQVATVGRIELHPNLVNVVAARAAMTVDLRNTDAALMAVSEARLFTFCDDLAAREGVSIERRSLARFAPVDFDARVIALVEEIATARGHTTRRLPSGAGHDAQMLARVCPAGMVFVPSIKGISHNPAELTDDADLQAGANVLLHVLLRLAADDS